jgi:cytochrome c peroxidase
MSVQRPLFAALLCLSLVLPVREAGSFPVNGDGTVLPTGTELNEDAVNQPSELFHSQAIGGRKPYLVNLGDMAFSAPTLLGGVARKAGMSCSTCHINGTTNAKFFLPGNSQRPGTFDPTGPLFNPKADNGVHDAVTIPSLRGARYLAPYGHNGRMASLRDFVRSVIVDEFAGPEPSPVILDAIVTYIQDIDFLPNPSLGPAGRLTANASEPERRGEVLFNKPFPHDPNLSCAACHIPSGAFVDHRQHDIGSGGLFKTPTLRNADFNAPYFHDGRYNTYAQVVGHFDRVFDLGLSPQDRSDMVAYLTAVGDASQPNENDGVSVEFTEATDFASVLDTAIPAHDNDIIQLAVDTVDRELRDITELVPDQKDATVVGGLNQRLAARKALKELVLAMRRIGLDSSEGQFDEAAVEYRNFCNLSFIAVPIMLTNAAPWTLLNPPVHDAHYAAMRQLLNEANKN